MKLLPHQDAIGQAVYIEYRGGVGFEVVERDDGFTALGPGPALYLADPERWPSGERRALRHARGRVLDLGCNAGRHALYLQKRGHDVLGVDTSPLAIRTAKLRGLRKARVLSVTQVDRRLGRFETIVMLGNNFGLLANRVRARFLLKRFYRMTGPAARIITASRDPYGTNESVHLRYHQRNRRRGRMGGQIRMRVHYRQFRSPYFDYLLVSKAEMKRLLQGTGWCVSRLYENAPPNYIAILTKDGT